LIELLIVVAILGILAAIALPYVQNFSAKSKRAEAYVLLGGVHKAQLGYYTEYDEFYPPGAGPNWYVTLGTNNPLMKFGLGPQTTKLGWKFDLWYGMGESGGTENKSVGYLVRLRNKFDDDSFYGDIFNLAQKSHFTPGLPDGIPVHCTDDLTNQIINPSCGIF
jgi:type II secretory pathway pseudopilin PulG